MNEMLARIASQTNRYALYPSEDGWYIYDMNEWLISGRSNLTPPVFERVGPYEDAEARRSELNARAVVEVMREPTDDMIAAARRNNHPRDDETWKTMIAEILK